MRALIFDGQLHLDTTVPIPRPEGDAALLKIRQAGICNTDLELIAGMYHFSGILGHEFVGEVVQGPTEMLGKRVVGEINIGCGNCDFCRKGIPSQCRNRKAVGIHQYPGAFADYLTLPIQNLHSVPETVDDETAVFVEPLAAALQITESVHISSRDHVVILGLGKLGLLAAQVLRLTGAEITGVARYKEQANLLREWGITSVTSVQDLPPERAQIVVECTGQPAGFEDALRLIEPRGTIVMKSTYHGLPQINLSQVARNEIRIIGSRCGPFDAALRLLNQRLVDVKPLIEAHYPFEAALEAMQHAGQRGSLKVLLDF